MTTEPKFKQGDICIDKFMDRNRYFLILSTDLPIKYIDLKTAVVSTFTKGSLICKYSTVITNDPSVTPDNFADKYPELLI